MCLALRGHRKPGKTANVRQEKEREASLLTPPVIASRYIDHGKGQR